MHFLASFHGPAGFELLSGAGGVEKPRFDALMPSEMSGGRPQYRKVQVPPHHFASLNKAWLEIYTPVYEHMKVDIRMNLKVSNRSHFSNVSLQLLNSNRKELV